jgi:hypothetical protein
MDPPVKPEGDDGEMGGEAPVPPFPHAGEGVTAALFNPGRDRPWGQTGGTSAILSRAHPDQPQHLPGRPLA